MPLFRASSETTNLSLTDFVAAKLALLQVIASELPAFLTKQPLP